MATYGPYFPQTVAAPGWAHSAGAYSCALSGEGVTPPLSATKFGASVPAGAAVTAARLEISPDVAQAGFNLSEAHVLPSGDEAGDLPSAVYAEDGSPVPLTPELVNSDAFGFDLTVYAPQGGTVTVSGLALYVEVA